MVKEKEKRIENMRKIQNMKDFDLESVTSN